MLQSCTLVQYLGKCTFSPLKSVYYSSSLYMMEYCVTLLPCSKNWQDSEVLSLKSVSSFVILQVGAENTWWAINMSTLMLVLMMMMMMTPVSLTLIIMSKLKLWAQTDEDLEDSRSGAQDWCILVVLLPLCLWLEVLAKRLIKETAAVTEAPQGAALIPPTGTAFHLLALLASHFLVSDPLCGEGRVNMHTQDTWNYFNGLSKSGWATACVCVWEGSQRGWWGRDGGWRRHHIFNIFQVCIYLNCLIPTQWFI